jgi:hypothetical protein
MKEQLNDIARELQEITTKELTQQEKRENEKLYKRELKRSIKTILIEEIEKQQQKGETIQNIYKNIVINDYVFIDKAIQDILNYKIIKTKIFKDQEEKEKKEQFILYPFKNFDIAEDVDNNFYTILKNLYNRYKLTSEALKNDTTEELRQLFLKYYNNYGYKIARQTLYNEENKQAIIIATAPRSRNTIQQNYYKILNEVDKLHKIQHPEQAKEQKQPKQTKKGTIKHKKSFLLGSILVGAINGLKKASK